VKITKIYNRRDVIVDENWNVTRSNNINNNKFLSIFDVTENILKLSDDTNINAISSINSNNKNKNIDNSEYIILRSSRIPVPNSIYISNYTDKKSDIESNNNIINVLPLIPYSSKEILPECPSNL